MGSPRPKGRGTYGHFTVRKGAQRVNREGIGDRLGGAVHPGTIRYRTGTRLGKAQTWCSVAPGHE